MNIYLTQDTYSDICTHGERGYPNEICGVLLGKDADGRRSITALMPIENSFEPNEQYHRYLITPDAMFQAERIARQKQLDVLGVYHSHPEASAQPSIYDRDHAAWTTWTYIIVSIKSAQAAELRAWKLRDDRTAFDEEDLVIE